LIGRTPTRWQHSRVAACPKARTVCGATLGDPDDDETKIASYRTSPGNVFETIESLEEISGVQEINKR
jgi:hypothetical protein